MCDVTRLQSGVSFSGVVMAIGVGAMLVGVDEVVVVVREACDVAVYSYVQSSQAPAIRKGLLTLCRHAAPSLEVTPKCLQVEGS